jgi:large subunit ribosomal protein L22
MTGTKTNERPGTRAYLRDSRMSASKAREVLDLIRGMEYTRARDVVAHVDRGAAVPIAKLLHSCAANAEHNDGLDPTELYVATCYADEGTTLKRWRPRARGRATRIRKRTCHITIILARMPEERLARQRAKSAAEQADRRARRVAGARRRESAGTTAAPVAESTDELDETTSAPEEEFLTPQLGETESAVATDVTDAGSDAVTERAAEDTAEDEAVVAEAESVVEEDVVEEDAVAEDEVTDAEGSSAAEDAEASDVAAEEGAN